MNYWHPLFKTPPFATQITHLTLRDPKFASFDQCMEIICSFLSLESLEYMPGTLYDYEWDPNLTAFQGSPPPPWRILDISFCNPEQLIWHWLHRSQTRLSTIKLGQNFPAFLGDMRNANFLSLNQYIQFLGPSLEVLQINFEGISSMCRLLLNRVLEMIRLNSCLAALLDNVDLTLNTGLRVLELGFSINFFVAPEAFDQDLSLLPLVLSRLPKATLTSTKFRVCVLANPILTSDDPLMAEATNTTAIWNSVDELLSGPYFPMFTKVAFNISTSLGVWYKMTEYLESRLARCKGRGLLSISFIR